MVDIIDFLERMGRDAELRHAGAAAIEHAAREAALGDASRRAIVAGDPARLSEALAREASCPAPFAGLPMCGLLIPCEETTGHRASSGDRC